MQTLPTRADHRNPSLVGAMLEKYFISRQRRNSGKNIRLILATVFANVNGFGPRLRSSEVRFGQLQGFNKKMLCRDNGVIQEEIGLFWFSATFTE